MTSPTYNISVPVTNSSLSTAKLRGWLDFNRNNTLTKNITTTVFNSQVDSTFNSFTRINNGLGFGPQVLLNFCIDCVEKALSQKWLWQFQPLKSSIPDLL